MECSSYYRPRGSSMDVPTRQSRGYSLIELLVVLVIVGVLSIVGVVMLGNKPSGSVRTVMDELEGTLSAAQKLSVATGRDVMVATTGEWSATNPMRLAYGDATLGSALVLSNGQTASETFRVAVNAGGGLQREHMYAGVVTVTNKAWWNSAASGSTAINSIDPFHTTAGFVGILTDANNLFQGNPTVGSARISGADKRFVTTFWIGVVGLSNGQPLSGGPMGVLVVQAKGAQIYKFYNPGIRNGGDGTWRRI